MHEVLGIFRIFAFYFDKESQLTFHSVAPVVSVFFPDSTLCLVLSTKIIEIHEILYFRFNPRINCQFN